MRTKSFPIRRRSLPRAQKPSLLAVASPEIGTDEEHISEGDELNTSHDHQTDTADTDVEVFPDSFGERPVPPKEHQFVGTDDTSKCFDSLKLDACVICGVADDHVLPCSGVDCPVALHWKCVNSELDYEDVASCYCPYCWFKNQVLKSKALRKKASAAEKALLNYLGKEMNNKDSEESGHKIQEEETSLLHVKNGNRDHSKGSMDVGQCIQLEEYANPSGDNTVQGEENKDQSTEEHMQLGEDIDQPRDQQGQVERGINELNDQHMELGEDQQQNVSDNLKVTEDQQQEDKEKENSGDGFEALESEKRLETEKWQDAEDGKDEEADKEQEKGATEEEKNGDVSTFASMQETFSVKECDHVQSRVKQKRRLKQNEEDSYISSTESTNDHNEEDLTKQSIGSSKTSSPTPRQATSPVENRKNEKGKSPAFKATKKTRKVAFVKNEKRRKMFWTPEEEEMLKVGVEKFSAAINKNIPWRKILEMGENVFHETRNPMDLKDKWRVMTRKR